MEKVVGIFQQGPRRQARFLDNIGKTWGHTGAEDSILGEEQLARAIRKVAISGQKSSFILTTRFEARSFRVR